ncbi:MAG: MerR family DNA-binding protein [Rhodospirillales bacterium]|nr:MerR family DNA-binding protein [Rhodospirillales bacterium]
MKSQHSVTTIGKAAKRVGVNIETIRFYERRALIEQPPKPASGGFRDYPPETLGRIRFIREAQELGFSLNEAGELLALRADPNTDCAAVQRRAEAKLAEVRRKIEKLETIGTALQVLIAACPGKGALDACSIMDSLATTGGTGGHQNTDGRKKAK